MIEPITERTTDPKQPSWFE
jgi:hypothetical protein